MNRGIISKLFGFKWSVYFCVEETIAQYIMHSNYPYDMIGTIEFWFEKYQLQSEWQLFLNYNMTDEFIEIRKDNISEVMNWMHEVSPYIKRANNFVSPNCVDCTGGKERNLPLYSPQMPIDEQLKYLKKHGSLPVKRECFSSIASSKIFK